QKLRTGDIDFIITSTANASTLAPQAGVFSLHFIFRDQKHLANTLADPAVSKAFREMIKDSVQGAQVLGLLTMGFRNIYSKKDIKNLDDIKGMKVRMQATKTEDKHFPAYGKQTLHMQFGEVNTVDGVDKSGFEKAAKPIQDSLAKELGPHAVKILELVRNVK